VDLQPRERTTLITGGSQGIGLATAEGLSREGARVVRIGGVEDCCPPASLTVRALTSHLHHRLGDASGHGCE
jgi:NAD(P)-dependent dehydrogenase (short-subunit alcohol dehydrogenase family)